MAAQQNQKQFINKVSELIFKVYDPKLSILYKKPPEKSKKPGWISVSELVRIKFVSLANH